MNIIVDLNTSIKDGTEVVFRSPVDCSQVTGLKVYCPDGSQEFVFADAHGNNVGDIDHLFAENVAVKVILDVTTGMAFVQNADTNAYLEGRFEELQEAIDNLDVSGGEMSEEELADMMINIISDQYENGGPIDEYVWNRASDVALDQALTVVSDYDLVGYDEETDEYSRNVYTKEEVDAQVGDIETAIDSILAIQNQLMGGDSL